jgi:hypothetical protein
MGAINCTPSFCACKLLVLVNVMIYYLSLSTTKSCLYAFTGLVPCTFKQTLVVGDGITSIPAKTQVLQATFQSDFNESLTCFFFFFFQMKPVYMNII